MGRSWRDGTGTLAVPRSPAADAGSGAGPGGGLEAGREVGPGAGREVGPEGGGGAGPEGGLEVGLEIAASYRARRRGLLGRDGIAGAMLLTPANSVHTLGMRFPIDVAYLDRRLRVLAVVTMRPGRLGLPRPRARHVLEAEAGAMARWGVRAGTRLTLTADPAPGA
ncbi:DUF192 domain-containing protein [Streptomyces roseolus]|uniref:DUF192 domain-containing protein n=1 Tax=Streptomyces roseolus TaxID=67358 RepID=UPI001671A620|nr:DUF192 domain-containing protein [Streptomyces roseolus]GGR28361.1 hypothetical protein GCM10010282_20940 [Streptomyces roseolus]